mmetsp:Transcript_27792/g.70862  ORF Transcript_27792/g.70862 Transcript_27792/m.70862 type:complete len:407 (-) Transcript_27792:141-1361(-)
MTRASSFLFFLLCTSALLLSPLEVSAKKRSVDGKKLSPITSKTLAERDLLDFRVKNRALLREGDRYNEDVSKHFLEGTTLAYVTPWNGKGYDWAKTFGQKWDLVSPVWFQVRRDTSIGGEHDVDAGWMGDVRRMSKNNAKIVPRFMLDGWDQEGLVTLAREPKQVLAKKIGKNIRRVIDEHKLDGYVLEILNSIGGLMPQLSDEVMRAIATIQKSVQSSGKGTPVISVLVIPPYRNQGWSFGASHFDEMERHFDYFSLMTYDYSNAYNPGPNAPLQWMYQSVTSLLQNTPEKDKEGRKRKAAKILLGLNFYGNEYTMSSRGQGRSLLSHDFLSLLQSCTSTKGDRLEYDAESAENFLVCRTNSGVTHSYYPTPRSISERVNAAKKLGTGISIWEIGQGLNSFADTL